MTRSFLPIDPFFHQSKHLPARAQVAWLDDDDFQSDPNQPSANDGLFAATLSSGPAQSKAECTKQPILLAQLSIPIIQYHGTTVCVHPIPKIGLDRQWRRRKWDWGGTCLRREGVEES